LRTENFSNKQNGRYWWHKMYPHDPPVYTTLSDEEWSVLDDWFTETDKGGPGELAIPFMSVYLGFVGGSCLSPLVECGGYHGYSAMLTGFEMRRMGQPKSFVSVELQSHHCEKMRYWIDKAGLNDYVHVLGASSIDPNTCNQVLDYLGREPQAILLDSVHDYDFKLQELNLWYPHLQNNGFIFAHDTSEKCQVGKGDRIELSKQWKMDHPECECMNINKQITTQPWTYKDGQGMLIVQKF
jgi:predicted O-methyltransferase YrrM